MPSLPCLVCGRLSPRSRCPAHELSRPDRRPKPKYSGAWRRQSEKARRDHVREHGWVCPGWRRAPHPSTDLTVDHDLGVLCRSCNSAKGATLDKARLRESRGPAAGGDSG